jgi:hypothetical protein
MLPVEAADIRERTVMKLAKLLFAAGVLGFGLNKSTT